MKEKQNDSPYLGELEGVPSLGERAVWEGTHSPRQSGCSTWKLSPRFLLGAGDLGPALHPCLVSSSVPIQTKASASLRWPKCWVSWGLQGGVQGRPRALTHQCLSYARFTCPGVAFPQHGAQRLHDSLCGPWSKSPQLLVVRVTYTHAGRSYS